MGLINYQNINFSNCVNEEVKTINFNGSDIQILPYLPIKDKFELIMATIKKSYINEMYDPIRLSMYFNLHIVYMYTNIFFSIEDKVNEDEIYDMLYHSGLLDLIKDNIEGQEIEFLNRMLQETLDTHQKYNDSITGFLSTLVGDLAEKVKTSLSALKSFDPEAIRSIVEKAIPSINNIIE